MEKDNNWFKNDGKIEKYNRKHFTMDLIKEVYNDVFNKKHEPKSKTRTPSIEHYEWEEDGQKYSSWKIDTGSSIMYMGDAGKELFDKALKDNLDI